MARLRASSEMEGKLEVTYRRNLYKSYMCIKAQEDIQEEYELHMLEKQKIPGLLPMQRTAADGLQTYLYEISGKQQIEDYLSGKKIDYAVLQRVLFSIQSLCQVLPDYLLREEGLSLELQFIYVNLEDGSMYFTYLPFGKKNLPEAFKEFMEQVLRKINHQDLAATDLAYRIYQMCTRENANIGQMLAAALEKQDMEGSFQRAEGQKRGEQDRMEKERHGDAPSGNRNPVPSERAEKGKEGKKGRWRRLTTAGAGKAVEKESAGKWHSFADSLPFFLKKSFLFSYMPKKETAGQGKLFPKAEEKKGEDHKPTGEWIPKRIPEKGFLGSERERVREISRKYFQKEEIHAESERAKAKGILKDYGQEGASGKKPEKRKIREISEECLQEVDLEQVPERKPIRGISAEPLQKTAMEKGQGSKPAKENPIKYPQPAEFGEKPDRRPVRGIPKEYFWEADFVQEPESSFIRGIPREDMFQSESANKTAGTFQVKELAQGLPQDTLPEKAEENAAADEVKKEQGWLRRKRRKENSPYPQLPVASQTEDSLPKEPLRYATEILVDFAHQPEGILVYQGAHGCGDLYIEGAEFLVGKNKDQVHGVIDARGVSRLHARIVRESDIYYIEDLNSTNGTYLNGVPLEYHQRMELCKDDHIRFGSEEYVFC